MMGRPTAEDLIGAGRIDQFHAQKFPYAGKIGLVWRLLKQQRWTPCGHSLQQRSSPP